MFACIYVAIRALLPDRLILLEGGFPIRKPNHVDRYGDGFLVLIAQTFFHCFLRETFNPIIYLGPTFAHSSEETY